MQKSPDCVKRGTCPGPLGARMARRAVARMLESSIYVDQTPRGDVLRTTIHVDDDVFDDLVELTAAKTKTEAVRLALQEYIRLKRKEELLALRGQFDIEDNWEQLRALDRLDPARA